MSRYTVEAQEDLQQILSDMGRLHQLQQVLRLEANRALFATRTSHVLMTGDELEIPDDASEREEDCLTDRLHRFVAVRPRRRLALELRDSAGRPRQGHYRLEFDGETVEGELQNGRLQAEIHLDTTTATLTLGGKTITLHVARLEPVASTRGLQARLLALGFLQRPINGELDDDTVEAIAAFQLRHRLPVTGQADPRTRRRLVRAYGV